MGEERFDEHMKQIVLNFKYEHEEGRLSAMHLASMAVDKLPLPLLEKYAQLFFLPLVLQTANDESKECREAAASCLSHLLRRSSLEVLQTFFDYAQRWSKNPGPVQATSLRLFGIFVESCDEFLKRGGTAQRLMGSLSHLLCDKDADWEILYLSLLCLEKLSVSSSKLLLSEETDLWVSIIDHLAHSHPWVKLVSCRVVSNYLLALDTQSFDGQAVSPGFLVKKPGLLFLVVKNLCVQLNVKEEEQNDTLADLAIKSLAWILPVMKQHPHLCFEKEEEEEENDEDNREREPVQWLMTRLSSMAKNKGTRRRGAIFKCFAAFATSHNSIVSPTYLELMLEPLHRAIVEASNETENPNVLFKPTANAAAVSEDISLARDVLQLLEESCTASEDFLRAYAKVKTRARDKKEQRKIDAKTEAVLDPQEAAKRKVQKQLREKSRKKRRVDERRLGRGDKAKRRHGVT
jgi:U3 small nucleolar RNA-associated protein 20